MESAAQTSHHHHPESLEAVEENHYHDLDDLCLDIENDSNGVLRFTPATAAASYSHYDLLGPARDDVPPVGLGLAGGYMSMEGSSGSRSSRGEEEEPQEHLDSTDEEDDEGGVVNQEDIDQLRREVLQASAASQSQA